MMRSTRGVLIGTTAAVMLLVAAGAVVHADETQQSEQTIETEAPEKILPGEEKTGTAQFEATDDVTSGFAVTWYHPLLGTVTEVDAEDVFGDGVIHSEYYRESYSIEETESFNYTFSISTVSYAEPGEEVEIVHSSNNETVTDTIEIVEPSVDYYATENGEITTDSLLHALKNWRNGVIETSLLRDVVVEWRATS